jgi:glutathione peroxidase
MGLVRREFVGLIGGVVASPAFVNSALGQPLPPAAAMQAIADDATAVAPVPVKPVTAHDFGFDRPGGGRSELSAYAGRPILIVNTATNCGFAGQLAMLELLWQRYSRRGLMLLATPSNDFGGQEPLQGQAIADSARATYGATYAFTEKLKVRGPNAHPYYRWAAMRKPGETPGWNFHKYLIGRDGDLVGGFPTSADPIGPQLIQAIGKELQTG